MRAGSLRGLKVFLNGRVLPLESARVSVFDRGLLFGDGVYETMRAYRGRPFRLAEHLVRLESSARRVGIRIPASSRALVRGVSRVLHANRLMEARVRIVVSRGSGVPNMMSVVRTHPTVLIYAVPFTPPRDRDYNNGVRAIVPRIVRNDRRAVDPAIKSSNLLNNMLAASEARAAGAREAIMLNGDGFVAEAASANVFFVSRGRLRTPALSTGILKGITRDLVLDLGDRLGLVPREGLFRLQDLLGADEVFVTASTIEILPVASIGRRRYPRVRPCTRALQQAYRVIVQDELAL